MKRAAGRQGAQVRRRARNAHGGMARPAQLGEGVHQAIAVGMARRLVQLALCGLFDDAARRT